MTRKRMGVFICHCGGNISDFVDVEAVRAAVQAEPGVAVASTFPFACSDAAQEEMIRKIQEENLDGIVVASCSPKLHLNTFRAMAQRGGLNPYLYNQVNIREQCSWAHPHNRANATGKAARLVRAGIAKTRLSNPLEEIRVETIPKAMVIGAGIAGMRAALALSDIGITVYLVERAGTLGGRIAEWGEMFPSKRPGAEIIETLAQKIRGRGNITVFTNAEVIRKSGSIGNFTLTLRLGGDEETTLNVGSVVVATGFDSYTPRKGEFGSGIPGVLTLPEFRQLAAASKGKLLYQGRELRTIAYIYCVGSRQSADPEIPHPNLYCSRYCCTAGVHSALVTAGIDPAINQYHIYRDIRTYGKSEILYEEAGRKGSVFIRYPGDAPPKVRSAEGKLMVTVCDELLGGEELEIPADLVVLVTGMVPRENANLIDVLKLPVGTDGFFNEIHPKLRPVETTSDGIFVAGTAQGPKTLAESVASAMAAVSKSAALLLKGFVDIAPLVARIDPMRCAWCGKCAEACPYDGAVGKHLHEGKEVAYIHPELCKGCGGCVPACPLEAINLEGCTTEQVNAMIDALAAEAG